MNLIVYIFLSFALKLDFWVFYVFGIMTVTTKFNIKTKNFIELLIQGNLFYYSVNLSI